MNVRTAIAKGTGAVQWHHETLPSPSASEIVSRFPRAIQKKGWASGMRSLRAKLPPRTIPTGLSDRTWGELLEIANKLAQRSTNPALSADVAFMMFAGAVLIGGVAVYKYRPERERLCPLCPRHTHPSLKYCRQHSRAGLSAHRHGIRVHVLMVQGWRDSHAELDRRVKHLAQTRDPKTLKLQTDAPPDGWHGVLTSAGTATTPEDVMQDMNACYESFVNNLKKRFPDQDVYENYDFIMWKEKITLLAEQNKIDNWTPDNKKKQKRLPSSSLPIRIREMAQEGKSRAEIARICGVTRAAITRAIKRHNLKRFFGGEFEIRDTGEPSYHL